MKEIMFISLLTLDFIVLVFLIKNAKKSQLSKFQAKLATVFAVDVICYASSNIAFKIILFVETIILFLIVVLFWSNGEIISAAAIPFKMYLLRPIHWVGGSFSRIWVPASV